MPPRCYIVPSPLLIPAISLISSITNATVPTVTTSSNHNYVNGTIVRLDIPPADGMQQLNGLISPIQVTGPTTFTIAIDTTSFDVFSIPGSPDAQTNICALVVPIGEVTSTLQAAVQNVFG